MASPFTIVENATATFTLPTSGTVEDAYGNVLPATTTTDVTLFLKASPQAETTLPGVDATTTILSGYAVDPMTLDARIIRGTTGTLSWQGKTWQFDVEGTNETYGGDGFIATTLSTYRGDDIRLALRRQV